MIAFTSRPRFLLPYAPESKSDWTETHFELYDAVQLAIGQRKELTQKEIDDQKKMERVDAVSAGNSNESIIDIMKDMFNTDEDDFSMFVADDNVVSSIENELQRKEDDFFAQQMKRLDDYEEGRSTEWQIT